jgi:aspartate/methionine/tyrosine aminotransferase
MPTFAIHGLSKLCGLPQLKLSWIALAGPAESRREARRALEWIGDAFLSVSTPIQLALPGVLESRHEFRHATLMRVREHRAHLERAVRGSGAEVPSADGGWVSVLRLPEHVSGERLAIELLDDGVVVHPGHFYEFADDRHLVISLIAAPPAFAAGLDRLIERLIG